ncbi:CRISPR-associated protein Cas4 [Methanomicrobiaceae archaeon CYW5]|uniref:CRISPR-associated protein Cas4 n=1 Tax=Methanovulcanius yangii TaxID=1789227 RepID=UPI0029C9E8D6|nr:CRISPR-associated protein Cas4 [Methanovulcanius yangii]MBT8508784.1 CRISPR-associated protein Cas4 [Methanovulcanius yangii]
MRRRRYADDDLLALSGIQHFSFCRRQWALIHIERQWEDNLRTAEGHFIHTRVDDPFFFETRGDTVVSRAFPLVSYTLGFSGVADVIEYIRSLEGISLPDHEGLWRLNPVEYKRGKPKIDECDEVQLCAQVMCLEEMYGVTITSADFYYHEIRRRVHLSITDELRNTVRALADEMHDLFERGITPMADPSRNCRSCSLVNVCFPKLTKKKQAVDRYIQKHVNDAAITDY